MYKVKVNPSDEVIKYKARLVARRFLQKERTDYGKVYALVASM